MGRSDGTQETRERPVEEPANTLVRFIYEQRFDPITKHEERAKAIKTIRELDKDLHELKLTNTGRGWHEAFALEILKPDATTLEACSGLSRL